MSLHLKRLDHVAVITSDLDHSVAFYRDVLGLETIPRPDFDVPGAWFSLGGKEELHVIVSENQARGESRGHFALEANGIETFSERVLKLGIPHHGPQRRPDGAIQFFIEDPDGNTVELTSDLPK